MSFTLIRNNTTLTKLPGSISGQPFNIIQCHNSKLEILDHCDQVQIDNVTKSKIFIGACSESVFIRDCTNCTFTVACKQLRTRDCSNCTIYLYCKTEPIIESSTGIKFGKFNGAYPGHDACMKDANLDPKTNKWYAVYDFNDELKMNHNWEYVREGGEDNGLWCPLGPAENCCNPCDDDSLVVTSHNQDDDTTKELKTEQTSDKLIRKEMKVLDTSTSFISIQLNEAPQQNSVDDDEDVSILEKSHSSCLFIDIVKSNYCHLIVQLRRLIVNSFYCASRWINSISKSLSSWSHRRKEVQG